MNFNELDNVLVIAEIGVNHEGDFDTAKMMIEKAAEAGADFVKFQTYAAQRYVSSDQPERRERVEKFELSQDEFTKLKGVAVANGVQFFSTPLAVEDVDFLENIVSVFKVSSGDLNFPQLIKRVAQTGMPMIISTGLGTEEEIRKAIDIVFEVRPSAKDDGSLALMHCVAAYPTPEDEANVNNLLWLKETFGLPVGYSDHTLGIKACELAVAVGARIVEKHFTYRKEDQAFHDHLISADPEDLKSLVANIRMAEVYLGSKQRKRTASEEKFMDLMRRSIAVNKDVEAGVPIKEEWLTFLRPAWGMGLDEVEYVVGSKLKAPLREGQLVYKDNLDSEL
ncbi:MAG: N-acetylneuraminate synthase family protein [Pseudodesulfovibrio sp.]|nr:N-acetylneuraminate synthase family protein [Pseudodesulfovibrio sp.]